jgi:hypothetical protein
MRTFLLYIGECESVFFSHICNVAQVAIGR